MQIKIYCAKSKIRLIIRHLKKYFFFDAIINLIYKNPSKLRLRFKKMILLKIILNNYFGI